MSSWKAHERQVAKKLGGQRVSRGADFGESAPDVLHDRFSIECKYRSKISQFLKDAHKQAAEYDKEKIPLVVLKERGMHGEFVLMKLDDFTKLLEVE